MASHIRFVIEAQAIDLVGDYNGNGVVDAADYAVWRAHEGTLNVLANDLIGGQIGAGQYAQWRAHFGEASGGNGAVEVAVPEPGAIALALAAVPVILGRRAGLTLSA